MNYFGKILFAPLFLLLLSACTTAPVYQTQLSGRTLGPTDNIGVIWLSKCHFRDCLESIATDGSFTHQGNSGLLSVSLAEAAHANLQTAVSRLDASPIVEKLYLEKLPTALEAIGINSVVKSEPYSPQSIKLAHRITNVVMTGKVKGNRDKQSSSGYPKHLPQLKMDFAPIATELGTNYLMVLELLEYGAKREFGPFAIPTSPVFGIGAVHGHLVNTATGEKLLSDFAHYELLPEGTSEKDAEDNNTEGAFDKILAAIDSALESAINDVTTTLIKAVESQGKL